jgi:hypothetical protein
MRDVTCCQEFCYSEESDRTELRGTLMLRSPQEPYVVHSSRLDSFQPLRFYSWLHFADHWAGVHIWPASDTVTISN